MINSKQKGNRGEREFSNLCKQHGYETHRTQQYCGKAGDSDVTGIPGLHIEVKRVEKLNIYNAIEQAVSDKKDGEVPIVAHRKDRKEWLITMRFSDWIELYKGAKK